MFRYAVYITLRTLYMYEYLLLFLTEFSFKEIRRIFRIFETSNNGLTQLSANRKQSFEFHPK